jgi:outer membrane protein assembly factor BamD (BamD/ComL family)
VQHLPGANQVPEALAIMVKSYQAMGEKQLADDALEVMKINYPKFHLALTKQAEGKETRTTLFSLPFLKAKQEKKA